MSTATTPATRPSATSSPTASTRRAAARRGSDRTDVAVAVTGWVALVAAAVYAAVAIAEGNLDAVLVLAVAAMLVDHAAARVASSAAVGRVPPVAGPPCPDGRALCTAIALGLGVKLLATTGAVAVAVAVGAPAPAFFPGALSA